MALSDAVDAIRARAESLWPDIEDVAITFENEPFDKPIEGSGSPAPFVLIEIMWNGGEPLSIGAPGSNRVRRDGHIWAHAFIPQGSGASRAHQIAGEAAGMFENQDFNGVVCLAAEPAGQSNSDDGNYFGQSVAVPFSFDETA